MMIIIYRENLFLILQQLFDHIEKIKLHDLAS